MGKSFFSKILEMIQKPKTKHLPPKKQEEEKKPPEQPIHTQPTPPPQDNFKAQRAIEEARAQAREIIIEARDEAFKIKKSGEEEARKFKGELLSLEQKIAQKEENIDRKTGAIEERERQMDESRKLQEAKFAEIENIKKEQIAKLERAAGLTRDEAKKLIMDATQKTLKEDLAKAIKESENEAREEADKKAKEILVDAMRHGATDYVAEYTVSTIKITDEDVKGKIIGKEGRNIRSFEQATGVDVDLDEENVIRLSCFDPVRREIARVSLEQLMKDGRIQPSRIEEVVEHTTKEIEKIMFVEGENLCHAVGVYNMPSDKTALLGRFKYRFSYGQNMIVHTLEETKIGIALARELNADVNIVRLACLLHDVGKVITSEEGTHVDLAVELLKKDNMPQAVIDCVSEHHEDKPFSSIESVIVYIADAISGSRPGARYENIEEYIKRMKDLEDVATTKEGVQKAYAIQAGREIRVVVDPGKLDDAASIMLAKEIKEDIQKKLTYPGQIKVTVIRELRTVDIAK